MKPSIDVSTRVSAELSARLEALVNHPDREEPATLGAARAIMRRVASKAALQDELMHPQQSTSLLRELDALVEEYGEDAPASDFVVTKASEALSRIIETVTSDPRLKGDPTLGGVREVMSGGLTAVLLGDGAIDADHDDALLAEIDGLIERFGAGALAENFVRFE
jgi:AcrR family transcriptional regulator